MIARYLAAPAFAVCLGLPCVQAAPPIQQATAPATQEEAGLLDPAEFAPDRIFAPPPARNSAVEMLELERVRALRAGASPERLAQAERDGEIEDPRVFNDAAGRDLTRLPATYVLLKRIAGEANRVVNAGKLRFKRLRPYGVDPQLPHCDGGKTLDRGYPSGHGALGWSVGWTLARLMPDRAPVLLARAQDYSLSREICGAHFQSDLEASHVAAVLIADRLLADPRLAGDVEAARRELARN